MALLQSHSYSKLGRLHFNNIMWLTDLILSSYTNIKEAWLLRCTWGVRGSLPLTSAPSCASSPPRAGPSSAGGRADASPPEVPAVSPPSSSPLRRKRGLRWTSYFSDWSPSVCMLFWLSLTCSLVSSKDILSSISFVLFLSSSSFIFCSIILSTSSSSKIWKKRDTNYNNIIVGKKIWLFGYGWEEMQLSTQASLVISHPVFCGLFLS